MRIQNALIPMLLSGVLLTSCVPSVDVKSTAIQATELCLSRLLSIGINEDGFSRCITDIGEVTANQLIDYATDILQAYTDDALHQVALNLNPDISIARSSELDRNFTIRQIIDSIERIPRNPP